MSISASNWEVKDIEEKLKNQELILHSHTGKSDVWKSIAIVAEPEKNIGTENATSKKKLNFVACKKCLKCFKYDSHKTGTSHLKRHVEHCISSTSQSSGRQLKLPFKNCGVARQAKSDALNAAVSVVVKDLRPFSVFDGEGMKEFAQTCIDIGAKYGKLTVEEVLPSRNTIAKKVKSTALDQKTNLLASLKLAISNNSGFGVTSDLWTDDYKKLTYLSCTAHWLEDGKRKNSEIFCKLFQAEKKQLKIFDMN